MGDMMGAQSILVLAGVVFFLIAIVGSADSVQLKIANLPTPARWVIGVAGVALIVVAFTPLVKPATKSSASEQPAPRNSHVASRASASATLPVSPTNSPTPSIGPPVSISIQDSHTTSISYLHDVNGKMTGFEPTEAVWILVIIRGNPTMYPQGACNITGQESFSCADTQFGDPGETGTFYAQAIIVNSAQQMVLRRHYRSGLTSMPKVIAKSALVRYTRS